MADERTPSYVNIDDETQCDALGEACLRIKREQLTPDQIAELAAEVNATRGDRVGHFERRADYRETARMGRDGWNMQ
jgi:hypothetical protein